MKIKFGFVKEINRLLNVFIFILPSKEISYISVHVNKLVQLTAFCTLNMIVFKRKRTIHTNFIFLTKMFIYIVQIDIINFIF